MHRQFRPLRSLVALIAALATIVAILGFGTSAQAATPGSPTGLTPDSTSTSAIPVLSWDRQDDATTYDVQVSSSSTFASSLWTLNGTYNDKASPAVQLPAGTIYWRVRAHNTSGVSDWSSVSFTHTAASPPTLVTPADGATLKEGDDTPVFQWSPVAGATGYSVRIGQDADFTDPSRYTVLKSVQAQAAALNGFFLPNTYYWEVQAQLGTGLNTDWSAPRTLVLQGLDQPALQGPPDDINNGVEDVVLNWAPVAGAATYNLQVSTDANFNTTVVNVTKITGTRYSPPTTINNDQYYWRVRAVDASGNTVDWSQAPIWHFKRNWPDQPTLEYPQNNSTVGDPFYYQWSAVPHASEYLVQLSTSPNFTSLTGSCRTTGTTITPAQLYPGHNNTLACMPTAGSTYYWRVEALDQPKGVQSDVISAQVGKFTYLPSAPTQLAPANGASVSVPTMSWNPVPAAAQYEVSYTDTAGGGTSTFFTSALSFTPRTALVVGDTYRWQVQTVSEDGRDGPSILAGGQSTFTVTAPDAPSALTPVPTNTPTSTRFPTLTWTPVVGAKTYQVFVRPTGTIGYTQLSDTFPYPVGDDLGADNLSPGVYDWIVEAYDSTGKLISTTSTPGHFTISQLPQPTATAVGLTGNAITGNAATTVDTCPSTLPSSCQNLRGTPVLSWTPDPNAAYYKLYISYDAEMTNLYTPSPIEVYGSQWADVAELPDSQAGSAYYWEVVPCVAEDVCGPLKHATLAFNKESDQVVLNSPVSADPNNPTSVANDVHLSWQDYLVSEAGADTSDTSLQTPARIGPKQYRVQISTVPDFSSTLENTLVDQTTYTSFTTTYPEGPLYWRVQVVDDSSNNLNWSATGTFTKSSPAPTQTYPVSGGGGIPTVNGKNAFTWDAQDFAASYDLEVYKNDDLIGQTANKVLSANSLVTAYAPSNLLPASATPYTWRVRRVDAVGRKGPWSPLQEFQVTGDSPTLTSPVNDSHEAPNDTLFTWLASTNAAKYKLELRQLNSSTVFETVTTANTSWADPKALTTGDWQWRVTALDASGNTLGSPGNWTDMQFTVDGTVIADNPVSISGSSAIGSLLTAQAPTWSPTGVTTTYQWLRNGANIGGQTGDSYTLVQADVGKQISVKATGTKVAYANGTSISNPVSVTAGPAPVPSQSPSISGTRTVGQNLVVNPGTWPSGAKYTYRWLRNGAAISGATATSYRLQPADATKQIAVEVTASITGLSPGVATTSAVTIAAMKSTTTGTLATATVSHTKRAKVNVVVVVPGLAGPTGKIMVKQGKKTLATATLKATANGRKTLKLKKLGKGKHKLTVVYVGTASIKGSKSHAVVLHVT
ncbi:MAG TPA: Ig-like domain repeat protein [Nocardioides sp.]|nr:Ig-like domain repeat protein [Nocardioides sp.]